jgi:EAL domain-containing protein (putative c-di-GMP-specific phosphodiesterase class I)
MHQLRAVRQAVRQADHKQLATVVPEIRDFGGSIEEIELLRSLDIEFVRMKGSRRLHDEIVREALRAVVGLVRGSGATVLVDAVETVEQKKWWRDLGADAGAGMAFCADVTTRWPG